jgi:hypothetical protein
LWLHGIRRDLEDSPHSLRRVHRPAQGCRIASDTTPGRTIASTGTGVRGGFKWRVVSASSVLPSSPPTCPQEPGQPHATVCERRWPRSGRGRRPQVFNPPQTASRFMVETKFLVIVDATSPDNMSGYRRTSLTTSQFKTSCASWEVSTRAAWPKSGRCRPVARPCRVHGRCGLWPPVSVAAWPQAGRCRRHRRPWSLAAGCPHDRPRL